MLSKHDSMQAARDIATGDPAMGGGGGRESRRGMGAIAETMEQATAGREYVTVAGTVWRRAVWQKRQQQIRLMELRRQIAREEAAKRPAQPARKRRTQRQKRLARLLRCRATE